MYDVFDYQRADSVRTFEDAGRHVTGVHDPIAQPATLQRLGPPVVRERDPRNLREVDTTTAADEAVQRLGPACTTRTHRVVRPNLVANWALPGCHWKSKSISGWRTRPPKALPTKCCILGITTQPCIYHESYTRQGLAAIYGSHFSPVLGVIPSQRESRELDNGLLVG
jgi:hypothetical protein